MKTTTETKLISTKTAVRERVFINPGNRYIEFIGVDGNMIRLPNVIREFDPSWEDVPEPRSNTVIVDVAGRIFAIGHVAKLMKGKSAFDKGKLSMLSDSVYAALEPNYCQSILRVENLLIAVPDTRNPEAIAASKALVGTREYSRNGEALICTIAKVKLVEEATAAYRYGMANKLYQWPECINGVIDFGGGTSSGRLYSPDGLMLREASITLPGTNALAQGIQARLLKDTGYSADLSQIMDGIEDGSYTLGRNGETFVTHFASCREIWLDDIRSTAVSQWKPYQNDLAEVLLVGGSAVLAESLQARTKGRFKVAATPQDLTILGMGA